MWRGRLSKTAGKSGVTHTLLPPPSSLWPGHATPECRCSCRLERRGEPGIVELLGAQRMDQSPESKRGRGGLSQCPSAPVSSGSKKRNPEPSSGGGGGEGTWGFPPFLEAGSRAVMFSLEHGEPCTCHFFSRVLILGEEAKEVRQGRETWGAYIHVLFV